MAKPSTTLLKGPLTLGGYQIQDELAAEAGERHKFPRFFVA